jgi:hypothetical protein
VVGTQRRAVGRFVISDDIENPSDGLIGLYYLWRLLIDRAFAPGGTARRLSMQWSSI